MKSSTSDADGDHRAKQLNGRGRGWPGWPERLLGPTPGIKEVHLACWTLFLTCAAVPWLYFLWIRVKAGEIGGFVYFYGIGKIAHDYSVTRVYDYALQSKVFNQLVFTHGAGAWGPSPYPPFVALFFSLSARLPFRIAFILWVAVSLLLYLVGIGAVLKVAGWRNSLKNSLLVCFCVAFPPFLLNNLANGQLSSIAVCSLGLAIYLESRSKPLASGLTLALLCYKPTLLMFVVPFLLVSRRYRAFGGFVLGGAALAAGTTAIAGRAIWAVYLHFLQFFTQISVSGNTSRLRYWQFVDVRSFLLGTFDNLPHMALMLQIAAAVAFAILLTYLIRKGSRDDTQFQWLAWSAVLVATLLWNVYAPTYDASIVAVAAILTLGAASLSGSERRTRWSVGVALVTYVVAWFSEPIAHEHGVQLLTLALVGMLSLQVYLLMCNTQREVQSEARFFRNNWD